MTRQSSTAINTNEVELRAIQLRSIGKNAKQIQALLKKEFDYCVQQQTVRTWFMAGGRLEQAYLDYQEKLASASQKAAINNIKRSAEAASIKIAQLMGGDDKNVSLRAALGILDRTVPTKTITYTGQPGDDDLPEELSAKGDQIANESDDAPKSAEDHSDVGENAGEEISSDVLREPESTDRSGDTPA